LQTSAKNIYAAGDCLGEESSTDRAYLEGFNLAVNLINKSKVPFDYNGIIRSINTYPEIAVVGLNENDLIRRDRKFKKVLVNLDEVIASKIHNFDYGFTKLLIDRSGHILGATIVAPHANLIAQELALAIRHNLTVLEIASTPHVINDYSQMVRLAAKKLLPKH
ncbi:NAD(P)/FAD-dependent oxidoreductase, partial [Candidatus Saccharibacteria bacterium]|nr:NAD(P)/FAD-dependent oxidoreductase [Candidatus Saccharibacteria bacterium]